MEWVNLILSNLTGIAAVITLVITLVKYVQKAVKEKNWPQVVQNGIKLHGAGRDYLRSIHAHQIIHADTEQPREADQNFN